MGMAHRERHSEIQNIIYDAVIYGLLVTFTHLLFRTKYNSRFQNSVLIEEI